MSLQLSHSAANRYQTCAKSYEYHYILGYREKTTSAALIFGSAIDEALNCLLLKKGNAYDAFALAFTSARIGSKTNQFIPTNEDIVYSASDFDSDLLLKEDFEKLQEAADEMEIKQEPIEAVKLIGNLKKEFGWEGLRSGQRKFYNFANWLCLVRKGHLMITAYEEKVLPKIKSVKAVQRKITITNGEGDSIIGYVDAILEWEDGRNVIFDNKTSSIEYAYDAVLSSPQLILYKHALGEEFDTKTAGFIVLRKGIIKNKKKVCKVCSYEAEKGARHKTCSSVTSDASRCGGEWDEQIDPEVDVQILINDIPDHMEDIVMENYDIVNQLVKTGVFARNFNSCNRPWGPCEFKAICHKNDFSQVTKKEDTE